MSHDLFGNEVRAPSAIGSHESSVGGTDQWLTPPWLLNALGPFDLDPCAPIVRPWPTAAKHYTIEDDGLRQPWEGRVWCNPPYSTAGRWMHRLAEHSTGTALLFARTETALWFDHIWPRATALLFLRGRLKFHLSDGKEARFGAGAPSVLIAYGTADADILRGVDLAGRFVSLKEAAA